MLSFKESIMVAAAHRPIVLVVGTRPEGVKMVPLYFALKNAELNVVLCSTMQHDELLKEVFDLFQVTPDITLCVMRIGQDLFYVTQSILQKTKEVFLRIKPSLVLVQGDTTSTMAAALAAFYLKIPVGHIEAGLRTDDIQSPFPEEMNRRCVTTLSTYHFAPTALAAGNLLAQGVAPSSVYCTGNTVVDALSLIKEKIATAALSIRQDILALISQHTAAGKKIVLLTAHRRESFDGGIKRILTSVKAFLHERSDVVCIYPSHPNPHVIETIQSVGLCKLPNMHLFEPLSYKDLVYVLLHCDGVLTDSGGIQEEAISLGKRVLVLREKTERIEGVWAGLARIVGTDQEKIADGLRWICSQPAESAQQQSVYGDGTACAKITSIITSIIGRDALAPMQGDLPQEMKVLSSRSAYEKKQETMKKICILGLGYIGLPTAIVAAESGLDVIGCDIDEQRVLKINQGDPVIQEPELFEKLQVIRNAGNFKATTSIESADYFIIAVPTPFKEDKLADVSAVFDAARMITAQLKKGDTVILESTVPVGTTEKLAEFMQDKTGLSAGIDFYVAHCPERVLPGKIFHELVHNARIIGGINKVSVEKAKLLYKAFVQGELYLTDATTAEMVKLVENSSRDTQIAFAHQVASMAYSVGLNPYEVIELANKHPRVNILQPTCGVGGHCIAVDPWFLVESFPQETALLKAARVVNDNKPFEVLGFIHQAIAFWQSQHQGKKCKVTLLGLTYKPDVDDMRESPAYFIATKMQELKDVDLMVCEPHVSKEKLGRTFGSRAVSVHDGVAGADVVVYLVAHTRFKTVDEKLLVGKKILDFCGIMHEAKAPSSEQEIMFWPASSKLARKYTEQSSHIQQSSDQVKETYS
jgi:UDP-N-acetylglucosamine 2-epimerase